MPAGIPLDDFKLEMEETEGLLISPPLATLKKQKSDKRPLGNRWACFLLFLGIILGILFTMDTETLRFWEGNGGEHVRDVVQKMDSANMNSSLSASEPPTAAPVQPTAAPVQPTHVPVEPTYNPTDQLTPQPTNTAVETPVPTDVVAETPKPTDAVVETPPPTDAVVETSQPTDAVVETPKPTDAMVETLKPTDAAPETSSPTNALVSDSIPGAVPDENIYATDMDFGPSHYPKPSNVVKPDPPLTAERANALAEEWGKWEFVDNRADQRPTNDYCGEYLNRDIPRDKFPENAWQTDKEYLREWLDQADKLVNRALESILTEYGHGAKDQPDKSFEERSKAMFDWLIFATGAKPNHKQLKEAGWTTEKSFQGLVRRVLHALVTRDTFTFVVGGHSAAAGHGNHFKQSYAMQFHKVTEPVFGLLGVTLFSHNVAQGGLGTIQHSLGFKDIYGDKIDLMVWDSGMTEGHGSELDMFWRQALISGERVPLLISVGTFDLLMDYNSNVDADFAVLGEAVSGLPTCTDELQCDAFPWAARYLVCDDEPGRLCDSHKWLSNCWVDRTDVIPPRQDNHPGSQVGWHPGFRRHQLVGRNLSFFVLKALKEALTKWKESDEYALPDDAWHVTDYFANVRDKLHLKGDDALCYKSDAWPKRMCSTPMRAYTEFQPRPNPDRTSLLSILKPAANGFKPLIQPGNLYNGPDVFNPFTAIPEGEIDVLAIVSNGRAFEAIKKVGRHLASDDTIEPGLGVGISNGGVKPGYCDGTYNMECGRQGNCLLSGHGDSRACLAFHSYSGWLVMTLPKVKEGIIVSKIETWHSVADVPFTQGWTSTNNQGRRSLRGMNGVKREDNATLYQSEEVHDAELDQRITKETPPDFCDNVQFQFSINGKITSWDKATFLTNNKNPERVVEIQTLLDDPAFTTEPRDVELAIRMTGCGDSTKKGLCLTHIYFA